MNLKVLLRGIAVLFALQASSFCQEKPPFPTTLLPEKPMFEAVAGHFDEMDENGMQWRWSDDIGRRDVGQTFTANRDFTLDKIAVMLHGSAAPEAGNAPFTLSLYEFADAKTTNPGSKIAAFAGRLPENANGLAFMRSKWLLFDVPDTPLQGGKVYGFVLGFDAPTPKGQWLVLRVAPNMDAYAGGHSLMTTDGVQWTPNNDLNFLILAAGAAPEKPVPHVPQILDVDVAGSTPYKTIAAAARVARAGDTIRIKPNSGPYREVLFVPRSGTADAPITIDGGGNLITGFEPLSGWTKTGDTWSCKLPVKFPCVLTYRGERLVQDNKTKQFTKYATLNDAQDTITLLPDAMPPPGVEPQGWEVSARDYVVKILSASHHVYRKIRAGGSTNDGFNLHGVGVNLLFEDIEAFHNLDEGFSAHDAIESTLRRGKFWGNDNGIRNISDSQSLIEDADCYDNLGWGLSFDKCRATIRRSRNWGNGLNQIYFRASQVECENVTAYTPAFSDRPWITYKESARSTFMPPYVARESTVTGTAPLVSTQAAPP